MGFGDKEYGIVFDGGRLVYGWKHGFGYRWMPHVIQKIVVNTWNPIACRFLGHWWLDYRWNGVDKELTCVHCNKVVETK